MRPILLIMWTAFQSFILLDNNNNNNQEPISRPWVFVTVMNIIIRCKCLLLFIGREVSVYPIDVDCKNLKHSKNCLNAEVQETHKYN